MTDASSSGDRRHARAAVLVVDDDAAYRIVVTRMLERAGYSVLTAANGAAALELLRGAGELLPNLLVVDVRMPVMSGLELIERLDGNARWRSIPVIVASADRPNLKAGSGVGVRVWLRKPMDPDALLALIQAHAQPSR